MDLNVARNQYQTLDYQGPALDPERLPRVRQRAPFRFALAGGLASFVLLLVLVQPDDPVLESLPAAAQDRGPYQALSLARSEMARSGHLAPPQRPAADLFRMPAAPSRSSGFAAAEPDLG